MSFLCNNLSPPGVLVNDVTDPDLKRVSELHSSPAKNITDRVTATACC